MSSFFFSQHRSARPLLAATGLIVLAAAAAGCSGVRGTGSTTTDSRTVAAFDRVDASSGIDVVIAIGPAGPIDVRAQPNIVPLISTTVAGDTLTIRATDEIDDLASVTVVISVPSLEAITLGGGSDGTVTSFAGDRLEVAVSGGGDLTATGTAGVVAIEASGGADLHLAGLAVRTLDVEMSGGAELSARVSDDVRGSASGGASVSVAGSARINVQTSGGAHVGGS
jgi:hypothetical protein